MLFLLSRGLAFVVLATTPSVPPSGEDFRLSVTPSRVIVAADQLSRTRDFTVTNGSVSAAEVVAGVADFVAGTDGGLRLSSAAAHSAATWATLRPDRFHLAAGATQRVSMNLVVPAEAEPGEHQLAVIFSIPATSAPTGIRVTGAVGAPVYISVPSDGPRDRPGDRLGDPADSADIADSPAPVVGAIASGLAIVGAAIPIWMRRRRIRRRPPACPEPAIVEGTP